MRILLLLLLIDSYTFAQKQETLYLIYSEEKDLMDNYYGSRVSKRFWKEFLYRKNVWVFSSIHSNFIYDSKKHQKKELTKEDFLKLCVKNKSRVMYDLIADTFVNTKGDTIDINHRVFMETQDKSREVVYPKPKKPIIDKDGKVWEIVQPTPFYYHYINSFKAYAIEMTKDGRYFLYEVDWIFGFPTE